MPISKRNKKVSLTQTKKKGLEGKKQLVSEIQECVDKYKRIFVISVQNMRNTKMKDVRQEWVGSRFFFGKNRVTALALGKSADVEYAQNLHKIGEILRGQMGLLFTDSSEKDVLKWFETYTVEDYARAGNTAMYTVELQAGPIPSFSHSIEPQLRNLGLPTSLNRGVVTLLKSHTVCKSGSLLTPEQGRILKLFEHKMATFQVKVEAVWTKSKSHFKLIKSKNTNKLTKVAEKTVTISGDDLKGEVTEDINMESDKEEEEDGDE